MKRKGTSKTVQNRIKYFTMAGMILIIVFTAIAVNFNNIGMVKAATPGDPLSPMQFELVIDGVSVGFFTECTGIGSGNEIIEHRIVNEYGVEGVQKIPGRLAWNEIVLKRGLSGNMDLWAWRRQVEDGQIANARKTNISIAMYDSSMTKVAEWTLKNGWLSSINTATSEDGSIMEEAVLVCEEEERVE